MDQAEQAKMVHRHILQGERHVPSQRAIVDRLTKVGADTTLAEGMLEELETTLAEHQQHLARVESRAPLGS